MSDTEYSSEVWQDLAALIEAQPEAERLRYQRHLSRLIHDVRAAMGIVYSAESLLRRKFPPSPEQAELLDMIHDASKQWGCSPTLHAPSTAALPSP